MPDATRVMQELQRTVARLQAEVNEMKQTPAPPTVANEELFDGDYQPPLIQLQTRDEEDAQMRKFFQNSLKVRVF